MKIKDIISYLETIAPPNLQENYDNSGLIVGSADTACTNILLCLDATEAVIDEATAMGCNLVVAHHPIVFGGLKKLNGKNYVERSVIKAIRNDVAIYAIHTNLDNVKAGVNAKIAERLELKNCQILLPKSRLLRKISVWCPWTDADHVGKALLDAGGGAGNYHALMHKTLGISAPADPQASNKAQGEIRIETLYAAHSEQAILNALLLAHPMPNPHYDITTVENIHTSVGAGMIGELPEPLPSVDFLHLLKERMNVSCLRHTAIVRDTVREIALCGGAGFFLLPEALRKKADVYITADIKYHEFFDANERIIIADIGHYESEQFTMELILQLLNKKFPTFAPRITGVNTNPIFYL